MEVLMIKRKIVVSLLASWFCLSGLGLSLSAYGKEIVRWAQMDNRPQDVAGINALKKSFEAKHPNIEIKIQFIPWGESVAHFTTTAKAGNPPDASQSEVSWLASFVEAGFVENLSDRVKAWKYKDQYYSSSAGAAQIEHEWFGLPWFCGVYTTFYNKVAFKEAGLTEADVPKTWEELYSLAPKLSVDKDGDGVIDQWTWIWGAAGDEGPSEVYEHAQQYGGTVLDEDGNVAIDSWPWIQALNDLSNAIVLKVSPPETVSIDWAMRDRHFAEGYSVFFIYHNWVNHAASMMKGPDGSPAVGVAPYLYPTAMGPGSRKSTVGGSNLVVYKDAKNKDGAWKWIKFMSSPEGQKIWIENTMFTPTSRIVGESATVQDNPYLKAALEAIDLTNRPPEVPGWDIWIYEDARIILQNMLLGKYTPEQAASHMARTLQIRVDEVRNQ